MGNATSGDDNGNYFEDDEDEYAKQFDGIDTLGYRVLGVQPDSPGKSGGWRLAVGFEDRSISFFFARRSVHRNPHRVFGRVAERYRTEEI